MRRTTRRVKWLKKDEVERQRQVNLRWRSQSPVSETAPKASAKRKPRAKKLSKLDENAAEGDESVKPIAEPEAVEPALGDTHDVPEKTRKGGAKAKAKAKAKSEQKKEPKKKAKAKAKAKSRGHQDECREWK